MEAISFRKVSGKGMRPQYAVDHDLKFIGTVERVETTKTGFKNHRCIGQVPCKRWIPRDADGTEIGRGLSYMAPGWATRDQAAEEVMKDYLKKGATPDPH